MCLDISQVIFIPFEEFNEFAFLADISRHSALDVLLSDMVLATGF